MYAANRLLPAGCAAASAASTPCSLIKRSRTGWSQRFTWFLDAEAWHTSRGIPWKLGIVLHGPPGTGKTSLIHALASDFGFDIKYIKSLHGLGAAFLTGTKNDLFVIEDIDTIAGALNRERAPVQQRRRYYR